MKQKVLSKLSMCIALVSLFSACSNKLEYTNAIPSDVTTVTTLNLETLIDKAGLADKENEAAKEKMITVIKDGLTANAFDQLEEIIADPSESGIDLQSPIYFFTAPEFPEPAIVARISNEANFHALLNLLIKEQVCQPIEKKEGYRYTIVGKESIVAFNETTMFAVNATKRKLEATLNKLTTLMQQTKENSIQSAPCFEKMQQQEGEITFCSSLDAIPSIYSRSISKSLPDSVSLKDILVAGDLRFEKGKITLLFEYFSTNKEVEALFKQVGKRAESIDSNLLSYFPASTLLFFTVGVNGEESYAEMLTNEEVTKQIPEELATEIKELFSSVDGDISAGLLNASMKTNSYLLCAEVNDGDALKAFYEKIKELSTKESKNITLLEENEYQYKERWGKKIYFGVKDERFYATNDEQVYKDFGKPIEESIEESSYASNMDGKNAFCVVNFETIREQPIYTMISKLSGKKYRPHFEVASNIVRIEAFIEEKGIIETNIILKNKDENSLKQIVGFVRQATGM